MRLAVLLSLLAFAVAGCGRPYATTKPHRSRAASAPAVGKSEPQPAPAPARPSRPVPRVAAREPAPVGHDDEQPTHSPLDEVASMARELATRPPPRRPPSVAVEPPTAGRWLVVSVHDGDTVLCLDRDNVQHKVRIVGIDAPEIGQPFGTKSRDALRAMVLRRSVTVHTHGEDRYGRTLGSLEIDGEDVALRMLADGMAWQFTRYSDDEHLAAAERAAMSAGRGLWADPKPVPPWEWRHGEHARKAKQREPAGR